MKTRLVFVALLLILPYSMPFSAPGNHQQEDVWSEAELEKANTAADVPYMTAEEKKVLQLMNLARMDGAKFFNTYIQEYIKLHNSRYRLISEKSWYVSSLKEDLEKVKDLPLLYPDEALCKAAAYHAKYLGKKGKETHYSKDGTPFYNRIERFAGPRVSVSENIAFGFPEAVGIVGQMLVDLAVPDLGHRINTLYPTTRFVGIAIRSHKKHDHSCVMDFSGEILTAEK